MRWRTTTSPSTCRPAPHRSNAAKAKTEQRRKRGRRKCTADADCCPCSTCSDGLCAPSLVDCVAYGQLCELDRECCTALCSAGLGICLSPIE